MIRDLHISRRGLTVSICVGRGARTRAATTECVTERAAKALETRARQNTDWAADYANRMHDRLVNRAARLLPTITES